MANATDQLAWQDTDEVEAEEQDIAVDDEEVRAKPTTHSRRDEGVELILKEFGLNFVYREGLIASDFDDRASLDNQSRFGGLKADAVNRYKLSILRGDVLPAGVHRMGAKKRLVVVSGNHRRKSFDKAHEPFASYELTDKDIPRARLQELTMRLNRDHGEPLPERDRVDQAVHLVLTTQMTVPEAAAECRVSAYKVTTAKRKQDAITRATTLGIRPEQWGKIPPSTQVELATTHTDEGFRALTLLTLDFGLSLPEVRDIMNQIQATRSGVQQERAVQAIRESPEFQKLARHGASRFKAKRGQHATPRSAATRTLSLIRSFPTARSLAPYCKTEDERREMAADIAKSIATLEATRKELLNG